MQTITLHDGTVLNGICDLDDGYLYMYIHNLTMVDGFALFSVPAKTDKIIFNSYLNEYVYEGYTEIYSINMSRGNFNIVMRKADADAT